MTLASSAISPQERRRPQAIRRTFNAISFEEIRACIGDRPDVLIELLTLARKVGDEQLEALNAGIDAQDHAKTRFAVHHLRNTFTFLHARNAISLAEEIETLTEQDATPIPPQLIHSLNLEYTHVRTDLCDFLERGD